VLSNEGVLTDYQPKFGAWQKQWQHQEVQAFALADNAVGDVELSFDHTLNLGTGNILPTNVQSLALPFLSAGRGETRFAATTGEIK